jgi:hypothetical protein
VQRSSTPRINIFLGINYLYKLFTIGIEIKS